MKKIIYPALFILLIVSFSCKKNATGGKSKVKGTVNHHGKAISNAVVYIKFNATEFPGTNPSSYDGSVTANNDGLYEFNSLYKGEYYLYAIGKDYAIPSPYDVKGGVPIKIGSRETLNQDIPVTEN